MKLRGQIIGLEQDPDAAADSDLDLVIAGRGDVYIGGSNRSVEFQLRVQASRAALSKYTVGDAFIVTVEVSNHERT